MGIWGYWSPEVRILSKISIIELLNFRIFQKCGEDFSQICAKIENNHNVRGRQVAFYDFFHNFPTLPINFSCKNASPAPGSPVNSMIYDTDKISIFVWSSANFIRVFKEILISISTIIQSHKQTKSCA